MKHGAKNWKKSGCRIPTLDQVRDYFLTNRFGTEEGELFFFFHRSTYWRWQSGDLIGDWMKAADKWMWNLEN